MRDNAPTVCHHAGARPGSRRQSEQSDFDRDKAFGVAYKKIEENEKKITTVLKKFGDLEEEADAHVERTVNAKFQDVKKQRGWDVAKAKWQTTYD